MTVQTAARDDIQAPASVTMVLVNVAVLPDCRDVIDRVGGAGEVSICIGFIAVR